MCPEILNYISTGWNEFMMPHSDRNHYAGQKRLIVIREPGGGGKYHAQPAAKFKRQAGSFRRFDGVRSRLAARPVQEIWHPATYRDVHF